MIKSYFLLYGSKERDTSQLSAEMSEKFDFIFQKRVSDYIGEYDLYEGIHADMLRIQKNYVSSVSVWKEEEFKEFSTIIYVSFIRGRNRDKEAKFKTIKSAFAKIEGIVLLRETLLEE